MNILPLALIFFYTQTGAAIRCFQCIYSEIEGEPSEDECADPFDTNDRGSIPVPIECEDTLDDEQLAIERDPRCTEARHKGWEWPEYCKPLDKVYTHCRIMWITNNRIRGRPQRIVRSCATDLAEKMGKLHYYTGSWDSSTEVYTCNYNDCNESSWNKPSFMLIAFLLIWSRFILSALTATA